MPLQARDSDQYKQAAGHHGLAKRLPLYMAFQPNGHFIVKRVMLLSGDMCGTANFLLIGTQPEGILNGVLFYLLCLFKEA